jgi:putative flippase GtrA
VLWQDSAVMDPAGRWWAWGEKMPAFLRVPLRSPFIRFLLVGGLNTLFGYCVFALFILLGVRYPVAVFLASVAGVLFNFKTYGTLVFANGENRLLFRFFAVYGVCYVLNLIPLAWAERKGISMLVAGAVVAVPMAAVAFVLNRRFVFKPRES